MHVPNELYQETDKKLQRNSPIHAGAVIQFLQTRGVTVSRRAARRLAVAVAAVSHAAPPPSKEARLRPCGSRVCRRKTPVSSYSHCEASG